MTVPRGARRLIVAVVCLAVIDLFVPDRIPFEERTQTMTDITLAIVARYRSLLSIEAML